MTLITVLRVSKESHSGVASPQPSKSKTGRHPKTVRPSGKCFIGSLTVIFPISTTRPSSVAGASRGVRRVSGRAQRHLPGSTFGCTWRNVSESSGPYTTYQLPLTWSAMRRPSIACPPGKSVAKLSSPSRKNIPLRDLPKSTLELPPSCPTEGRLAIVTDAGRDAVDADAPLTNGA
jgi:hypothetical protein